MYENMKVHCIQTHRCQKRFSFDKYIIFLFAIFVWFAEPWNTKNYRQFTVRGENYKLQDWPSSYQYF